MGTYRSLMDEGRKEAWLRVNGYNERCRCHGRTWGPTARLHWRPTDHGENGPYEIITEHGEVVGTSDKIVSWSRS